jgi:hypothetical protein
LTREKLKETFQSQSPCLFLAGHTSPGQALLVRIRMSPTAITQTFQNDRPHLKRSGPRQADLQGWAGGQLERQQQSVIAEYFVITSSVVEEVLYCPSSIVFAALLPLHPSALLFWPLDLVATAASKLCSLGRRVRRQSSDR